MRGGGAGAFVPGPLGPRGQRERPWMGPGQGLAVGLEDRGRRWAPWGCVGSSEARPGGEAARSLRPAGTQRTCAPSRSCPCPSSRAGRVGALWWPGAGLGLPHGGRGPWLGLSVALPPQAHLAALPGGCHVAV